MHAHVNLPSSIRALLLLILLLPEITTLGGGKITKGSLAIRTSRTRLCHEGVVFESVIDKLGLGGVDAGKRTFDIWFG